MAFLQSAFVTIAEAEKKKKKKKKRQLEGGMLGLYDCLPHSTATRWGETVWCRRQHKPFTPGKDWKSQYEVMECNLNGFWWLKTETVCSSTPEPIPLSPPTPAHPPPPHPNPHAEEVRSLIKGQWAAKMYCSSPEREREESPFQNFLLSNMSERLMSLESQAASFPPTNGSLGRYWTENRSGHSLFTRGETVAAFSSLERPGTNIGVNKRKDTSNSEG